MLPWLSVRCGEEVDDDQVLGPVEILDVNGQWLADAHADFSADQANPGGLWKWSGSINSGTGQSDPPLDSASALEVTYRLRTPEGEAEALLDVYRYPVNWYATITPTGRGRPPFNGPWSDE